MKLSRINSFLQDNGFVWRSALASALAWEASRWAGSHHPYLAPVTVILVIQTTIAEALRHAWQRVLGTVIGVLLTASAAQYLGVHWWSIGLLLLVGLGAAKACRLKNPVLHQMAVAILLVLAFENHSTSYAWDRIRDTGIGALAGVAIQFIVPPDLTKQASRAIARLADSLILSFGEAATRIAADSTGKGYAAKQNMEKLFQDLLQTDQAVQKAGDSLQYNPGAAASRQTLAELRRLLMHLRSGCDHLAVLLQTLEEWATSGTMTGNERQHWAQRAYRLAELVGEWKRRQQVLFKPPKPAAAAYGTAEQWKSLSGAPVQHQPASEFLACPTAFPPTTVPEASPILRPVHPSKFVPAASAVSMIPPRERTETAAGGITSDQNSFLPALERETAQVEGLFGSSAT